jgi:hypothetical protein
MPITIRKLKHRPWPVTVRTQECVESGQVTEVAQTFIAHWAPFTEDLLQALFAEADETYPPPADGAMPELHVVLAKNALVFGRLICGWEEVAEETGAPLEYAPALLEGWVRGPDGLAVSAGLNTALSEIRFGVATAKNSPTSLAPGPLPAAGEVADATSRN